MPYIALLKNSSKKFLAPNPKADHFQNLINYSSLFTGGRTFIKIRGFYVMLLTDRHTDRQTDRQTPGIT